MTHPGPDAVILNMAVHSTLPIADRDHGVCLLHRQQSRRGRKADGGIRRKQSTYRCEAAVRAAASVVYCVYDQHVDHVGNREDDERTDQDVLAEVVTVLWERLVLTPA